MMNCGRGLSIEESGFLFLFSSIFIIHRPSFIIVGMAAPAHTTVVRKTEKPAWRRWAKIILLSLVALVLLYHGYVLSRVFWYRSHSPEVTALMAQRMAEDRAAGEEPK